MSTIQFPIAKLKSTGKLVNASDIHSDDQKDWICYECGERLIGVNRPENKQDAHFRHKEKCPKGANFETYIHWLTKEIFKEIKSLLAPSIYSCFSVELKSEIKEEYYKLIKDLNLPKEILRSLVINDTYPNDPIEIKNFSVSCERTFNSKLGDVRVDIVLEFGNRKIFVEPYLSNPIDNNKYEKLKDLDFSVLEIRLLEFVANRKLSFTIDEISEFLINDLSSKTWIHMQSDRLLRLIDKEKTNFKDLVKEVHDKLPEYHSIVKQQVALRAEIEKLQDEWVQLSSREYQFVMSISELLNRRKTKSSTG